jgi:hypothetical protein
MFRRKKNYANDTRVCDLHLFHGKDCDKPDNGRKCERCKHYVVVEFSKKNPMVAARVTYKSLGHTCMVYLFPKELVE